MGLVLLQRRCKNLFLPWLHQVGYQDTGLDSQPACMSVEPYSTPGEGRVQNHDPQWLTLDDIGINEQKVIPDEAVSLFSWFLGLLLSAVPAAQAATAVAMDQIVSGAFGNTHIVEYNFTAPYVDYVNSYLGNYCGSCDYGLPVHGNGVDVTYDKAGLGGAELISTYWLNPGTYTAEGIEYQGLNWGYQFRWMTLHRESGEEHQEQRKYYVTYLSCRRAWRRRWRDGFRQHQ